MLALASGLMGPFCSLASPLGITTARLVEGGYLHSLWFLSSYLGALAGLVVCTRTGGLWDELGSWGQAVFASAAIGGLSLLHASLAVSPYLAFHDVGTWSWLCGIVCVGHWAALGCFLQRMPLSLASRGIALTLLGWWLPAWLAADAGWERVRWVLAPARHLELDLRAVETPGRVLADTIPIVAWWVATALLPPRSALRR